jgi:hypothetical protein
VFNILRNHKRPNALFIKVLYVVVPVVPIRNQGNEKTMIRMDESAAVDEQFKDDRVEFLRRKNLTATDR